MLKLAESITSEAVREASSDLLIIIGAVAIGMGVHDLAGLAWTLIYSGIMTAGFGVLVGIIRGGKPHAG